MILEVEAIDEITNNLIQDLLGELNLIVDNKIWKSKYNKYVTYDYEPFCVAGFLVEYYIQGDNAKLDYLKYVIDKRVENIEVLDTILDNSTDDTKNKITLPNSPAKALLKDIDIAPDNILRDISLPINQEYQKDTEDSCAGISKFYIQEYNNKCSLESSITGESPIGVNMDSQITEIVFAIVFFEKMSNLGGSDLIESVMAPRDLIEFITKYKPSSEFSIKQVNSKRYELTYKKYTLPILVVPWRSDYSGSILTSTSVKSINKLLDEKDLRSFVYDNYPISLKDIISILDS